jgi:hypothetical protein
VTLTFSVFPRAFFGSVKLHELAIFFPFSVAVQLTRSGRIGVEVAVLLRHVPRVSRRLRGQDGCAAWSSQSADNCNNACRQSRLLLLAHRALRGAPTLNQPGGRVVVPREVARCSWPFGMSTPRDRAAVLEDQLEPLPGVPVELHHRGDRLEDPGEVGFRPIAAPGRPGLVYCRRLASAADCKSGQSGAPSGEGQVDRRAKAFPSGPSRAGVLRKDRVHSELADCGVVV